MSDLWILNMATVALVAGVGLYSLLTTKNLIKLLIAVEIVSKGVLLALISSGLERGNVLTSQSLAISFIVVEVSVLATALAILINVYRHANSLDISDLAKLKG